MKKMIFTVIICFSLFLIGCSNNEDNSSSIKDYEAQIDELQTENEQLKEEIQKLNSDYSVYLQHADKTSRDMMRLINEENYDQLKTDYNAEFEIKDGEIIFTAPENVNSAGFPLEQSNFPMSISNFNVQSENVEIGYYLDDLNSDERFLITFVYDLDGNFQYIYVGDV